MPEVDGEIILEGKKRKINFVGEEVEVQELVSRGAVPVQLPSQLPPFKAQYGTTYLQHVPRLFIVTNILTTSAYGGGVWTVQGFDYGSKGRGSFKQFVAPKDYKLRALTGRQGKTMTSWIEDTVARNFAALYNKPSLSVGSDPEVFIEGPQGLIPAFAFLPSKKQARTVDVLRGKSEIYWDGFQAEFTVTPNTCLGYGSDTMHGSLRALHDLVKKHNKKAHLSLKTVVQIPQEELDAAKDEHVEFGCAPSLNAYGLAGGGGHLDGRTTPFRFAGGHIHFGMQGFSKEQIQEGVKTMDAILAVACVPLFQDYDNPVRRQFYGLPGEYRLPPHGVEYRTLSNAWLCHPLVFNLVFELARLSFGAGTSGLRKHWKATEEEVISCIRDCNVPLAREMMDRNKNAFKSLLGKVPTFLGREEIAFRCFYDGVGSFIATPENISSNWCLDGGWIEHGDGVGKNFGKAVQLLAEGKKV